MRTYIRVRESHPEMQAETTKHCGRCGQDKLHIEFHRWRDGRQPWCRPCRRDYAAAHYQANKARRQAENKSRQAEFMAWYVELKAGRPCADCGLVFHSAAMQWDHLPGEDKTADLAFLARRGSRSRVLDEIEKCELVCASCHAVRSHLRRDATPRKFRGPDGSTDLAHGTAYGSESSDEPP